MIQIVSTLTAKGLIEKDFLSFCFLIKHVLYSTQEMQMQWAMFFHDLLWKRFEYRKCRYLGKNRYYQCNKIFNFMRDIYILGPPDIAGLVSNTSYQPKCFEKLKASL